MASPAVAATNISSIDAVNTSHTVNLPASISAGDLLIVVFGYVVRANTITWPGTFTPITNAKIEDGTRGCLDIAYRWADGTEGATITVTTSITTKSAHTSYRITGAENPSTQAPESQTGASGSGANADPPACTPTGGSKDYLFIAAAFNSNEFTFSVFPTNYTNGIQDNTGAAGAATINGTVGSAQRQLTAASDNPGTFTYGTATSTWAAQTVVIHPPAGGSTGTVAVTQEAQTSAASGSLINGTSAQTQAAQTSTASALVTFTATAAPTQDAQTSTASGAVLNPASGSAAVTQDDQTSTATATETFTATAAPAQDDQTSTASGSMIGPVTGTVAATQADQASTATAVEGFTGTSAAAQADQSSTASAIETITGTLATTQADQTSTASAVVGDAPSGTLAETQDDQTSTASGSVVVVISGTAAVIQADQTSTTTAVETFTGTSVNVQADQTGAAAGLLEISGTSTATQDNQTSTASGTALLAVTGTVAVTQADQFSTTAGDAGILTFWTLNPVGYTANPVSHTKAPVAFVAVEAGDTPPANWLVIFGALTTTQDAQVPVAAGATP